MNQTHPYKEQIAEVKELLKVLATTYQIEYPAELASLFEQFSALLIYTLPQIPNRSSKMPGWLNALRHINEPLNLRSEQRIEFMNARIRDIPIYTQIPSLSVLTEVTITINRPAILERMMEAADQIVELLYAQDEYAILPEIMDYFLDLCYYKDKKRDAYRTPVHISDFIVSLLSQNRGPNQPNVIKFYDPACGSGAFLASASKYFTDRPLILHGNEKNDQLRRLALFHALFHGLDLQITNDDLPIEPLAFNKHYNFVLTNPPFNTVPLEQPLYFDGMQIQQQYHALILHALDTTMLGGTTAIVVPDSFLFATQSTVKRIRQWMLQAFTLEGIIGLPARTFSPQAAIRASILFLTRPESVQRQAATEHVFFYQLEAEGPSNGRTSSQASQERFSDALSAWGQRFAHYQEWQEKRHTAADNLFGIATPRDWPHEQYWYAHMEDIQHADYILLPRHYQPLKPLNITGDPPEALLQEYIAMQEEILRDMWELLEGVGGDGAI